MTTDQKKAKANARKRAYYAAHREQEQARRRAYYAAHREQEKARSAAWRERKRIERNHCRVRARLTRFGIAW